MKKCKDLFYNTNDILLALLIICIAGGLIIWRVNVIMDYPETLAKATHTEVTATDTAVPEPENAGQTTGGTTAQGEEAASGSTQNNADSTEPASGVISLWSSEGTLNKDVTVTVPGGSAIDAAEALIDAGLFNSYADFTAVCGSIGRDPTMIKATTFTFVAGATQEDIATQVTD